MDSATLGQRLRLLIREKKMQQKKIGDILGMKLSTLSGYINDKREPTLASLKEMARYFNVTTDFLIGYSEERSHNYQHLSEDLNLFVKDPENIIYLELGREMKAKKWEKAKPQRRTKAPEEEEYDIAKEEVSPF